MALYLGSSKKSKLNLIETEVAIKFVKDIFERELALALDLTRVSAPLFVECETGLNDHLNGYERPVSFDVLDVKKEVEIVQSLAKWKRYALSKYEFDPETGLYTDMNAIRRDEDLDNIHSVYVDQWDWERIIKKEERTTSYLESIVNTIFRFPVVKDEPDLSMETLKMLYGFLSFQVHNEHSLFTIGNFTDCHLQGINLDTIDSRWANYNVISLNNLKHGFKPLVKGPSKNRPAAQNIYIGFMFYDTDLNKPVWWFGDKWSDE